MQKNSTKDQIKIKIDNLRARKRPEGQILGYINPGIYDISETYESNEYIWYKIENFWIAYSEEWTQIYLKEEIIDVKEPIDTLLDITSDKSTTSFWNKIKKI